jgi:hypothetical protein
MLFLCLLAIPLSVPASIIHVSKDGDGSDPSTWAGAFQSIGAAVVEATSGGELWVKEGTYNEYIINRTAVVSILGGFSGTEADDQLYLRDWRNRPTTINGRGQSISRVFFTKKPVTLDGLILTSDNGVGGLSVFATTGHILNCRIENNFSGIVGGGVLVSDGTAEFVNCIISNNRTNSSGGGLCIENSHVTLERCDIEGNAAYLGSGISAGAATLIVSNSTITNNYSVPDGEDSSLGGGIVVGSGTTIISNCIVSRNTAALSAQFHAGSADNLLLQNCTILGGASEVRTIASSVSFENCILWGSPNLLAFEDHTEAVVTHSAIQGGYPGEGNISDDPKFVDPANGDFHLLPDSPCIDSASTTGPSEDLDGNPRPVDIPGIGRDGAGAFDMGCYEFQLAPVPTPTMNPNSDIDQNGKVDANDLMILLADWKKSSGP